MKFGKNFTAYPSRVEIDGVSYSFIDAGLSLTVCRRGVVSHILTLSDGLKQFRLRGDSRGSTWTLLSVTA